MSKKKNQSNTQPETTTGLGSQMKISSGANESGKKNSEKNNFHGKNPKNAVTD